MDAAELISQVNIVEYISQYVDLEKKNDEWWGLSPFKVEKTPSFSVSLSVCRAPFWAEKHWAGLWI